MKKSIGGITLECIKGNIVDQPDISAIVNAANALLQSGGGVAGAIHRKAGPGLAEECRPMAPVMPGEAVITGGHNLPNPYVIHCLGPVYGVDQPEDKYLSDCYRNALLLADEKGIDSIAFPSISTGSFGFPVRKAATVAVEAIMQCMKSLHNVKKIRLVLFSDQDHDSYEAAFESAF